MADQREGGIAWTDQTWNPTRGCSRVSAGCTHCYAEGVAGRFSGEGQPYNGLAVLDDRGARWTGKVVLVEKHLEDPLRWRRPRRIFVNSMSDLFHEALDVETIARVFAVMALAPRHVFQVLTKRAERMRELVSDGTFRAEVWAARDAMLDAGVRCEGKFTHHVEREPHDGNRIVISDYEPGPAFPLRNVWLGVSVEHQDAAEKRIPHLAATPAAVRFLSCEPLIGPVDLKPWLEPPFAPNALDWIIVGGESGPGARYMAPEWARAIVKQCREAGVAPFVKQLGVELGGKDHDNIDTFPADLQVREWPRAA